MKPSPTPGDCQPYGKPRRGFALIVTLSLMILLTIIAVGLLTLSSISLRASGQGDSMQTARANARMALMMAISQLQETTGPDQRITPMEGLKSMTLWQGNRRRRRQPSVDRSLSFVGLDGTDATATLVCLLARFGPPCRRSGRLTRG